MYEYFVHDDLALPHSCRIRPHASFRALLCLAGGLWVLYVCMYEIFAGSCLSHDTATCGIPHPAWSARIHSTRRPNLRAQRDPRPPTRRAAAHYIHDPTQLASETSYPTYYIRGSSRGCPSLSLGGCRDTSMQVPSLSGLHIAATCVGAFLFLSFFFSLSVQCAIPGDMRRIGRGLAGSEVSFFALLRTHAHIPPCVRCFFPCRPARRFGFECCRGPEAR